jgi:PAS domain S-box-containing protein
MSSMSESTSSGDSNAQVFVHLFDGIGPCHIAEPDGQIVYVNRSLQDLLELHHEKLPTQLPSHIVQRTLQRDGVVRSNLVLQPADHRAEDEDRHFKLLHRRLGRVGANDSLILTTFEESTKEVQVLQAMRRSKERSDDLLGIVSDWVWEVDADWSITFMATRDDAILGRPADSLIGSSLFDLGGFEVNPELPRLRPIQRRQRASFHHALFRAHRPDGSDRLMIVAAIPVFNEVDGSFRGFRGAATDVTDRLMAEQAASRYRQQLEQTLAELHERNSELEEAVDVARKAATAKSEFLAMMSHELRTPLNAVIGFSELIASEAFGPLGHPNYKEYMTDILNSGRLLLSLINEILDFVKLEAGQMQFDFQLVNLREIADLSARFLAEQARLKQIELVIEVSPDCWALGDHKRLRQVLINLLSNAVKFTPEGGRVTVAIAPGPADRWALSVSDTGIGIAPENLDLVFQPFKQIDSALSRKYEGTGLGLPLARLIAEKHGGTLRLESELGKGTRLTLDLAKADPVG